MAGLTAHHMASFKGVSVFACTIQGDKQEAVAQTQDADLDRSDQVWAHLQKQL